MVGEGQIINQKRAMKNPPDLLAIGMVEGVSILLLCVCLYILSTPLEEKYALEQFVGATVTLLLGVLLGSIILIDELLWRPRSVEIGEEIVLDYRLRGKVSKPFNAISMLRVDPLEKSNSLKRRFTGGVVCFIGEWRANFVTRDIARYLENEYHERFGRYPSSRLERR